MLPRAWFRLASRHGVALTAVLALVLACADAAEVDRLHEAEVTVSGTGDGERAQALGEALRAVLVKVSGERHPETRAPVREAMGDPAGYVSQFQYRSGREGALRLWARFDPVGVQRLLTEAGLPIWGRVRPALLVWLALEDGESRRLVDGDDPAAAALAGAAEARGLPLIVPLLDLEDRARLSAGDVWAGFDERILEASRRYAPEGIVVARVERAADGLWAGRWALWLEEGHAGEWQARGESLAAALAAGVGEAADRLAVRYARTALGAEAKLELVVRDVQTVGDYARALDYLRTLDGVTRVDVLGVEAERVRFAVEARLGAEGLRQMIALGRTLSVEESGDGLGFRLLP